MIPDNASYYHAAYAVAIAVYGLYIVSLVRRLRTARERMRKESRVASHES